ncbi:ABC transporter substrate-binding protein [Alcaligenes pakistanensis]|uniref:sn-glycerol-3-phosphate-binding periplasmic protein UgpB n=1 Tax=Alcaligenes pakistanensis TaxID=1482717 RepID=A0A8H9M632_9BURK|nr:sn-glycerol-3-phosphate ABC transporter substrate-binding protein UgpB [Alcaligenes pakistanensis]MBP6621950.1 sn-glycerol-3-phosphate ABC transporter substrate-binding protein UgpB [Alcaligenes sp.]GHC35697.1 ABC transporter substrate-binding protein [Alcaligenes pakistanensis]HCA17413.1 sn-glycerol-3-phosphate ABC transporter substrate-binding protein UgpB [Alcaligenes faecalis]
MRTKLFALSLAGLIASIGTAHAATEIQFWHSMEGALGERVNALVKDFNASQSDYQVKASYKGNYGESMNAGVAAFRAGNAPDILQVFEVGTATMMAAKGAIQPVQEMSEKAGKAIKPEEFLGAVAGYYSSNEGKLISMPFNSSTPVLYYNKDAFKKAGLDAEKPPKTWQELHEAAKKLRESGQECGYTSSWPSWILLENFAAWHNIPFASENNGFGGPSARLQLDNPLFLKHLTFLTDMSKDGTFSYGGRGDTANALFTSGKCGMFTGSSGNRANIIKTGEFEFGTSSLPYYSDVQGAPQNSIIGGASLWVFAKKSDEVYKGVTEFFHFISSPEQAAAWHQDTGYVPVTKAGFEKTKESDFYTKNVGADVAVKQLDASTTENSRGIRLGSLPQIRDIEDGVMEQVFAGKVTPEEGLKAMQNRGNELLERFEKSVK